MGLCTRYIRIPWYPVFITQLPQFLMQLRTSVRCEDTELFGTGSEKIFVNILGWGVSSRPDSSQVANLLRNALRLWWASFSHPQSKSRETWSYQYHVSGVLSAMQRGWVGGVGALLLLIFLASETRHGAQQADSHASVSKQSERYSSTHLLLAAEVIIVLSYRFSHKLEVCHLAPQIKWIVM